jgi:hypothetical protein
VTIITRVSKARRKTRRRKRDRKEIELRRIR